MKAIRIALLAYLTLLTMAVIVCAQGGNPLGTIERGGNKVIGEEGLVSVIGEEGLVSIIGEDSLAGIIGEDSLVIVVAPVDSRSDKIIGPSNLRPAQSYLLRGVKTGRTLQLRISAADLNNGNGRSKIVGPRNGDRVTIKARTAAWAKLPRNSQLTEVELPRACCTIISTEKDPASASRLWVTAQNNSTNKKFRFVAPAGPIKFNLLKGQPLSTIGIIGPGDSRGGWVLLQSSSSGIKGRPQIYSYQVVAPDM